MDVLRFMTRPARLVLLCFAKADEHRCTRADKHRGCHICDCGVIWPSDLDEEYGPYWQSCRAQGGKHA